MSKTGTRGWIEASGDCARLAEILVTEDVNSSERKETGYRNQRKESELEREREEKKSSRQELPVSLEHTNEREQRDRERVRENLGVHVVALARFTWPYGHRASQGG